MCRLQNMQRSEDNFGSRFPSTTWVLGINLRSSDLVANTFTRGTILPAPSPNLLLPPALSELFKNQTGMRKHFQAPGCGFLQLTFAVGGFDHLSHLLPHLQPLFTEVRPLPCFMVSQGSLLVLFCVLCQCFSNCPRIFLKNDFDLEFLVLYDIPKSEPKPWQWSQQPQCVLRFRHHCRSHITGVQHGPITFCSRV